MTVPDSSPPSPAQRPTGQTVDLDLDGYGQAYHVAYIDDTESAYAVVNKLGDEIEAKFAALLADLDAAREALRRVEQERDETLAKARTMAAAADRFQRKLAGHECVPTQDAYDAACAALEMHRQRANAAEAEADRMRPVVEAARAWRDRYLFALGRPGEGHGVTAQSRELVAAVDTYETLENTDR